MTQFIMGLWCGCLFTILFGCCIVIWWRKYGQKKNSLEEESFAEVSEEKKMNMSFLAPQTKLLLVDDSRLSRTVIKEFLCGTKIQIAEVENGPSCLVRAAKEQFDLIFLDQLMPGMDGAEVYRRLREAGGENEETPIVAVSSVIRKENEKEFENQGYAGCLGKPIQAKSLEKLLLRLLPQEKVIQKPEGFSYENGLSNFDGNDAVYRETLCLFSQLWEERQENLSTFLQEGNMQEYAILIHGIKGDARTLGADILAKLAYEQEIKAKEGNIEAVRESFERVIRIGKKTAEYFSVMYSE